jgi:hypothetical protein
MCTDIATPCTVTNCKSCSTADKCAKCTHGTYLLKEACVDTCPDNFRADRITWSCLQTPVFAWYWIFPSNNTCKDNCGKYLKDDWDCSCQKDCVKNGMCCQDFEDFCPSLVNYRKGGASNRKNSIKVVKDVTVKKDASVKEEKILKKDAKIDEKTVTAVKKDEKAK